MPSLLRSVTAQTRGLARADEQHVGRGRDRHVARVGHDRVQVDPEARRQLDPLQVLADRVGVGAGLRHRRDVEVGRRDLHLLQLLDVLAPGPAAGPANAAAHAKSTTPPNLLEASSHGFSPWREGCRAVHPTLAAGAAQLPPGPACASPGNRPSVRLPRSTPPGSPRGSLARALRVVVEAVERQHLVAQVDEVDARRDRPPGDLSASAIAMSCVSIHFICFDLAHLVEGVLRDLDRDAAHPSRAPGTTAAR